MDKKGHVGECIYKSVKGFEFGKVTYFDREFSKRGTHDDVELVYILSGTGVAWVGDKKIDIQPGTTVFVAPKTPHCIKVESEEPIKAVYCHSGSKE